MWESFDSHERAVVFYIAAWSVVVALLAARRSDRERFKREVVEELAGDGRGGTR